MKKQLLWAILAGSALAGCVKNEPIAEDDGSPEPITFDAPVVSVPTKAEEIVGNYPGDRDFAVFALYHTGDFVSYTGSSLYMDNVQCKADNTTAPTTWNPETTYYWPKTGKLTFAAYAPAQVEKDKQTVSWDANGFHFTDFTVAGTSLDDPNDANDDPKAVAPAGQYDLLYSGRVYNVTKNSSDKIATNNPYSGVTILFKHALSSIVFAAKTKETYDNTTIEITGIKVNNVVSKGTFDQHFTYDTTKKEETEAAKWTVSSGAADVKNYVVFEKKEGAASKILSSTTETYFGATTAAANGKRSSDLILIPQKLDENGREVTVTVNYTITHTENGITSVDPVSASFNLAVGGETDAKTYEWEMSKRYTYHIHVGLDKIYFNPTVAEWADETGALL